MALPVNRYTQSAFAAGTAPPAPAVVVAAMEAAFDRLAYDRLARRFLARFRDAGSHTASDLWAVLDRTIGEMVAQGVIGQAESELLRACVCRDLAHIASVQVRGEREHVAAMRSVEDSRGAASFLMKALRLSGDAVYRIAGETRRTEIRRAGEATCAGTLTCMQCEESCTHDHSTSVSRCADCGGTAFVKTLRL